MSNKSITNTDTVRLFADAVYQDIGAAINPIPDGGLHRFDDPEGKQNNRACWYVFHLDGISTGVYGNWRTGEKFKWRESGATYSQEERALFQENARAAKAEREQATRDAQARAAKRALEYWQLAELPSEDHPYLLKKCINGCGLREFGGELIVPLKDINYQLVNLQHIRRDGTKRFLYGGRITGCFALIARAIPDVGEIYIAEGFATASTFAFSRMVPAIAAMNAGNLTAVAQAVRLKHPHVEIIIVADNDHLTSGNPGLVKGREAAEAVGGSLIWPMTCGGCDCSCTDFNDTARCKRQVQ